MGTEFGERKVSKIKSLYACLRTFCDISTVRTSVEYSSCYRRAVKICVIGLHIRLFRDVKFELP